MSEQDSDLKLVDKAIQDLSEHFDSVQIFVSRHLNDDEGTATVAKGSGNWYARWGQTWRWVQTEDEYEREQVRKREREKRE